MTQRDELPTDSGLFVAHLRSHGTEPDGFVGDFPGAAAAVRDHGAEVRADPALEASASRFLAEVLRGLRDDTDWGGLGFGGLSVGNEWIQFGVVGLAERMIEFDDARRAEFLAAVEEWRTEVVDDSTAPARTRRERAEGQPPFERPAIAHREFLDEDGLPIPYGTRWGVDGPPTESYSVDAHPERFAPLHDVADALLAYLERWYDVEVVDEAGSGATGGRPDSPDAVRTVRVIPAAADAAPITVAFTRYPGVLVSAGVLSDGGFPQCGCDACDDTAEAQADELERYILGVVAGGFVERYPLGSRRLVETGLVDAGGSSAGRSDPDQYSPERLAHAEAVLAALPDNWQPWPSRPAGDA